MKKTFVLDTNVLLHNAESIESFADNDVLLPMAVIEELDTFKRNNDELGRNARQVIRTLDKLREQGSLRNGVPIARGGTLRILAPLPAGDTAGLTAEIADNRILRLAYQLHRDGNHVIFVSKDINARLKADALGIQAVDFERQTVNMEDLYSGFQEITVTARTIDTFFKQVTMKKRGLGRFPNEFLILKDKTDAKRSGLGRVVEPGVVKHLSSRFDSVRASRPAIASNAWRSSC